MPIDLSVLDLIQDELPAMWQSTSPCSLRAEIVPGLVVDVIFMATDPPFVWTKSSFLGKTRKTHHDTRESTTSEEVLQQVCAAVQTAVVNVLFDMTDRNMDGKLQLHQLDVLSGLPNWAATGLRKWCSMKNSKLDRDDEEDEVELISPRHANTLIKSAYHNAYVLGVLAKKVKNPHMVVRQKSSSEVL